MDSHIVRDLGLQNSMRTIFMFEQLLHLPSGCEQNSIEEGNSGQRRPHAPEQSTRSLLCKRLQKHLMSSRVPLGEAQSAGIADTGVYAERYA